MAKKIEQIVTDLNAYLDKVEASVNEDTAIAIGYTVVTRMRQFIAQGQSPIEGQGRYSEYKAVTGIRAEKTRQKSLRASLRASKTLSKSAGRNRAEAKRATTQQLKAAISAGLSAARAQKAIESSKGRQADLQKGYPYSVQKEFPGKRPRPVNLFLSGAMLAALTFDIVQSTKNRVGVVVGYFDEEQAKKERGHREGVNGQPKRPTIPTGSQTFNKTIELDIMSLLKQAIQKALRSVS